MCTSGSTTKYHFKINTESEFKPEGDRYHLFSAKSCPFAHRVEIVRKLKNLDNIISITFCDPIYSMKESWSLNYSYPEGIPNPLKSDNIDTAIKLYQYAKNSNNHGGKSLPILFDKKTNKIVNNESNQIILILNESFNTLLTREFESINLYPTELQSKIDQFCIEFNVKISTGTYHAGHAKTDDDYILYFNIVFAYLDKLDQMLGESNTKYIFGDNITLADIYAFPHLIRFDPIFYSLFKLNKKHIWEYKNIRRYITNLLKIPAFQNSTDVNEMKKGGYKTENNSSEELGCIKVPLGNGGIEKFFTTDHDS